MNFIKKLSLVPVALMLNGCSGSLYTYTNAEDACIKENGICTKYEGVLYRPLELRVDKYIQDKILNAEGEVTHFAGGVGDKSCEPTEVTEEKLAPSLTKEYLIQYDSAFFETSEFSVDLSANGTLSKVGTSSTPGGKSLIESFTGLATSARTFTHGYKSEKLINDGKTVAPLCSHGRISIK